MRFLSAITTVGTVLLTSSVLHAQVQADYGGDYGDYGDDGGYYGGGGDQQGYDDPGYGGQDTLYQDYAERKQAKEYVFMIDSRFGFNPRNRTSD